MNQSFQLFRISGIPLKIHWTFPLLFLYIAYLFRNDSLEAQLVYVGFVGALFVCVVLHELGHALAARRYGVATVDIILSPIGGVARLQRMPTKPVQELIVALAGPLVNVVIAAFIALGLWLWQGHTGVFDFRFTDMLYNATWTNFLMGLMVLNVTLVLFNLIPAFPMDGGRVFRALLSMRWSRLTATRVASLLGQLAGAGFVLYGLYTGQSYTLPIIGAFIFVAARNEYKGVRVTESLKGYAAKDIMRTHYTAFEPDTLIIEASEYLTKDTSGDFMIARADGSYVGILTRMSLIRAAKAGMGAQTVLDYATDRVKAVSEDMPVLDLYELVQAEGWTDFLVENEARQLVGLIDIKAINEFMNLQQELGDKRWR